ncbi:MAG: hypothetical protein I3J02_11990 [Prevotella sp.]|nr:hypothetical protein [Prevotella sp.]
MTNRFLLMTMCVILLSSCTKKASKNGLLGEIPSIVKQNYDEKQSLQHGLDKASKNNDVEKVKNIMEKGFALQTMLSQNLERVGKELIGREIPVEMANNITMRMDSAMVINQVSSNNGTVVYTGQASLTKDASFFNNRPGIKLSKLASILVDQDKKAFATATCHYRIAGRFKDTYEKGTVGTLRVSVAVQDWNAEQMERLHHIVITQTDRSDYMDAQKTERQIRDAFKEKSTNK